MLAVQLSFITAAEAEASAPPRALGLFPTTMSSPAYSLPLLIPARLLSALVAAINSTVINIGVFAWDSGLALYNLVAPNRPANAVVPEGCPGAHGVWPKYVPPAEGDSRCSCPALNAMANHGTWETAPVS